MLGSTMIIDRWSQVNAGTQLLEWDFAVIPGPPISGLPEIGICCAQVGYGRLGCAAREPGIQ